jgi:hypothetical protein
MAQINLPERGQPLDVAYIYSIVEAVNALSKQISSSTYKTSTIEPTGGEKTTSKTSETRIVAGYREVANNTTVSAGNEISFSYDYSDFKFPPIASATPVNIGGTSAGENVTVVLKSVTTTRVDGIVRFSSSGSVSLNVHLVLVGIPN